MAARFVSGTETNRLPSYSAARRSETKLRQRWASTVAPMAASRCSVDTTWPVLSVPTGDQSLENEKSSVGARRGGAEEPACDARVHTDRDPEMGTEGSPRRVPRLAHRDLGRGVERQRRGQRRGEGGGRGVTADGVTARSS